MQENERNIFSIHGLAGMSIATVLLLGILITLQVFAIGTQQDNAENFYEVKDAHLIKKSSTENSNHIVLVK